MSPKRTFEETQKTIIFLNISISFQGVNLTYVCTTLHAKGEKTENTTYLPRGIGLDSQK